MDLGPAKGCTLHGFPYLFDGETLSSGLRRHAFLVGASARSLGLFVGVRNCDISSNEGLPSSLSRIADLLPASHPQKDVDVLISRHTIAPALSFFESVSDEARYSADGTRTHRGHAAPKHYHFEKERSRHAPICRHCFKSDILTYGVPLTRRELLIPGVSFCPSCGEALEWPCIQCERTTLSTGSLSFARLCNVRGHVRRYVSDDLRGTVDELRLLSSELARTVTLGRRVLGGAEAIWRAYAAIGCRRGNLVDRRRLLSVLQDNFTFDLLESLRLIKRSEDGDFEVGVGKFRGDGRSLNALQWMCLVLGLRKSLAAYESDVRSEPPLSVSGSSTWIPVWRERALECFAQTLSIKAVASELELSAITVRRELRALGVSIPQRCTKRLFKAVAEVLGGGDPTEVAFAHNVSERSILGSIRAKHPDRYEEIANQCLEKRREVRRAVLLQLLEDDPRISRTALSKRLGHVGHWLRAFDRDWYDENVPTSHSPPGTSPGRKLTRSISDSLTALVRAKELLATSPCVRRITSHRIMTTANFSQKAARRRFGDEIEKKAAELEETIEDWIRRSTNQYISDCFSKGAAPRWKEMSSLYRKASIPQAQIRQMFYELVELRESNRQG